MQKRSKKTSKKADEDDSIEKKLDDETAAISKIWLLLCCESQSAIVDLDDCVTPPELKIGSEVVDPKFGSGTLVALSNNKKELEDHRFALCKTYNRQTKKAQRANSESFQTSHCTTETTEIHLSDLMTAEEAYKEAIYKEIQYALNNPVMQFVSNELHNLFFDVRVGTRVEGEENAEEPDGNQSDCEETESEREDAGEGRLDEEEDETGRNSGDDQRAEASKHEEKSAEEQAKKSEDAVLERERNSETKLEKEKDEEEEQRKEKEKQEVKQGAVKKSTKYKRTSRKR